MLISNMAKISSTEVKKASACSNHPVSDSYGGSVPNLFVSANQKKAGLKGKEPTLVVFSGKLKTQYMINKDYFVL